MPEFQSHSTSEQLRSYAAAVSSRSTTATMNHRRNASDRQNQSISPNYSSYPPDLSDYEEEIGVSSSQPRSLHLTTDDNTNNQPDFLHAIYDGSSLHSSSSSPMANQPARNSFGLFGDNTRRLRESTSTGPRSTSSDNRCIFSNTPLSTSDIAPSVVESHDNSEVERDNTQTKAKKKSNAGRKKQAENFGGTGSISERRLQKPRYWELHDDCVEMFANGGNPKMADFRGRKNDRGENFPNNEFRSLKDHANPKKGVKSEASRAKKEEMIRQVLADRAARRAAGAARKAARRAAAQKDASKSKGTPTPQRSLPEFSHPLANAMLQPSRDVAHGIRMASSQTSASQDRFCPPLDPYLGSVNIIMTSFNPEDSDSRPRVVPAARHNGDHGRGILPRYDQGYGARPGVDMNRPHIQPYCPSQIGFELAGQGYGNYDGFRIRQDIEYSPNLVLQGRTTMANIPEIYGPLLDYKDCHTNATLPNQPFRPHEHMIDPRILLSSSFQDQPPSSDDCSGVESSHHPLRFEADLSSLNAVNSQTTSVSPNHSYGISSHDLTTPVSSQSEGLASYLPVHQQEDDGEDTVTIESKYPDPTQFNN